MGFFLGLGSMLVLWLGSREVITGRITLGEFVAFNAYLTMLAWPMIAFGWVTNMIQRGMASWKRMLEVMDTVPAINRTEAAPPTGREDAEAGRGPRAPIRRRDRVPRPRVLPTTGPGAESRVRAHRSRADGGVCRTDRLGQVDADQPVGAAPRSPAGEVFVDGIDVRNMPLATLRGAIGFVPQEPFLFSDTLAANVAFGLDAQRAGRAGRAGEAGREERRRRIEAAAEVARLDKDVDDFPKGYETIVGERGITLSGGQKQRTAIARAIVIDPRILILDDALSAVDTYTEEEILARLRDVMRQRTSIIVSHRISTVRDADRIFVLDQGRIVERGTHDELIGEDGCTPTSTKSSCWRRSWRRRGQVIGSSGNRKR